MYSKIESWARLSSLIGVPIRPLAFEGAEERLHGGVVITIPFPTHAHLDTRLSLQSLIGAAGVLAPPIRGVQQAR
ncbi:MAG: hypothetical protein NVSMB27_37750 [Ktedonobacteraceae bacterium]